jgi:hypothetical protein
MNVLTNKNRRRLRIRSLCSVDDDGTPIVQFFVNKDDAITYNTMLEALGQDICYH